MIIMESAAATNVGNIRQNNEDNYFLCGKYKKDVSINNQAVNDNTAREKYLFSVCDGMGGEQYGELASLIAVSTLEDYWQNFMLTGSDYIAKANELICEEISRHNCKRIGTTFSALYVCYGMVAYSYNIGDSRVYIMRDGKLTQLSVDHTQAQRLVRQGFITPEEALHHPDRNKLTQHMGISPDEMIIEAYRSKAINLKPGDRFLICSDGLTDMLTDVEIAEILSSDGSPESTADSLINAALENGGRDNITVIVARAVEER